MKKLPPCNRTKAVLIVTTCYILSYAFPVTGNGRQLLTTALRLSIFYAPGTQIQNCNLEVMFTCRYLYRTPTIPGSLSTDRSRADYCLRHRFSCLIITRGCKRCQEWKAYFIGSFPRFYGIFGGVRCYLDMGMVKSWYLIRKRK